MLRMGIIYLLLIVVSCSSDRDPIRDTPEMTSSENQDLSELGTSDVGEDFDRWAALSGICKNLDEKNCEAAGCQIVRGSKFDSLRNCVYGKSFALCSAAPQCNNGLIFHLDDGEGGCWEINSCIPREWREAEDSICSIDSFFEAPFCKD